VKLEVLGFSPPYPNPGAATSGYVVHVGDARLLVDCGHGVGGRIAALDPTGLDGVVISHMHPDHFFDLIALRNVLHLYGHGPLPCRVPVGGERTLRGIVAAMGFPADYLDPYLDLHEFVPGDSIEISGTTIESEVTIHPVPTALLRFADGDAVFVYTSDTGWFGALPALCEGASLLLIEATNHPIAGRAEEKWHLSPSQAGRVAQLAGVERVVITHYRSGVASEVEEGARDAFGGWLTLASEGLTVDI
jgi:ribonuclease BN (tRNA processing enzyme)